MPRPPGPRRLAGFEGWLFGDVDELGAAVQALGLAFEVVTVSPRQPLPGARFRQYLHAQRPVVPSENTDVERAHEQCETQLSPSSET